MTDGRESARRPRWVSLSDAAFEIETKNNGRLRYAFGDTAQAIENAIRSNNVPLRGRANFNLAFERIDGKIADSTYISRLPSEIRTKFITYIDVEIELFILEKYMIDNLVLPGINIIVSDNAMQRSDARSAVCEYLSNLHEYLQVMTKEEFYSAINAKDHPLYESCGGGKLSKKALDEAWHCAPEPWQRPGRRPRQRN